MLLQYLEAYAIPDGTSFGYKQVLDEDLDLLKKPNLAYDLKKDMKAAPEDLVDQYKPLKNEPGKMIDVAKENSNYEKYQNKNSGLKLSKLAKDFEDGAALDRFKEINGLTNDDIVKQVTIEVNGENIRLDFIGKNPDTGKFYFGEAKYSSYDRDWNNSWKISCTKKQKPAFTLIKDAGPNSVVNLVVKATDPKKIEDLFENLGLNPNDPIEFDDVSLQFFGSFANELTVKPVVILKSHN